MPDASLTQSAVSALKWNYGGVLAKQVCTFVIGVVLARLLGPGPFGVIAIALLLCGFANLIADFGFGAALVQRKTLSDVDVRFAFGAQVVLAAILTGITFAAAPLFAAIFHQPAVLPVIRVLSAIFMIQALGQVSAALLKRDLRFRDLQGAQVGSYVVAYAGVGIPLATVGYGVWSLVTAQLLQTAIRSVWQYSRVRHPLRFAKRPSDSGLQAFGAKVIATNIANYFISNLDNAFVGRFFTVIDLGFYSRMFVLVFTPVDAIVSTLQQVLFPAYSRAQHRHDALNRTYLASVSAVLLLVGPAAVAVAAIPETVVGGLLGVQWLPAAPMLAPLALAAPFHAAMAMAGPVLWGRDEVGRELRVQAVIAALAVGVFLIATHYSVIAIAWAVAGLYVMRCGAMTVTLLSKRQLEGRSIVSAWACGSFMAAAVALPVFLVDRLLPAYLENHSNRLLVVAATGIAIWAALPLLAPGAFISRPLRLTLENLRANVPPRVLPLLDQLTVASARTWS